MWKFEAAVMLPKRFVDLGLISRGLKSIVEDFGREAPEVLELERFNKGFLKSLDSFQNFPCEREIFLIPSANVPLLWAYFGVMCIYAGANLVVRFSPANTPGNIDERVRDLLNTVSNKKRIEFTVFDRDPSLLSSFCKNADLSIFFGADSTVVELENIAAAARCDALSFGSRVSGLLISSNSFRKEEAEKAFFRHFSSVYGKWQAACSSPKFILSVDLEVNDLIDQITACFSASINVATVDDLGETFRAFSSVNRLIGYAYSLDKRITLEKIVGKYYLVSGSFADYVSLVLQFGFFTNVIFVQGREAFSLSYLDLESFNIQTIGLYGDIGFYRNVLASIDVGRICSVAEMLQFSRVWEKVDLYQKIRGADETVAER